MMPSSESQLQRWLSDLDDQTLDDHPIEEAPAYSPVLQPRTEHYNTQQPMVGERSIESIRADFPILSETVDGNKLVWLDNAATTHKPRKVIERISYYYEHENSNVHRGAHTLAARSTDAYEAARKKVAQFIGAKSASNIVFVRGTTEGVNLIANAYVKPKLQAGDEIILTVLEHHANIVPWQLIAQKTGALLRVVPIDSSGQFIMSEYVRLFNPRTKFVSSAHVSNAHGIVVRTGHHCAQPAHRALGYEGSVRPSIAFYNTFSEIDYLVEVLLEFTR
ncbi:MAG: hypothetical protein Ta2G_02740 [Termitinemataceae bacterium]|nr:MAG: hypothetical protein Ta2G_02740 [Termitinemataceae bacterium]